MVKIFPCSALGGAKYLRALKAPLPQVKMLPTGGVSPATAPDYIAAGAAALGVGSELADLRSCATAATSRSRARAKTRRAVQQARAALGATAGKVSPARATEPQTMKPFMDDNFLLETPTAAELYHEFAKPQPIIDYHCHLSPEQIADNHRFSSLTEVWLGGDHYKWRAMRTNGVAEQLITGDASDWEKFRGMGANGAAHPEKPALPLDPPRAQVSVRHSGSAARPRDGARDLRSLQPPARAATSSRRRDCSRQFRVLVVCSTDDPVDTLEPHRRHAQNARCVRRA